MWALNIVIWGGVKGFYSTQSFSKDSITLLFIYFILCLEINVNKSMNQLINQMKPRDAFSLKKTVLYCFYFEFFMRIDHFWFSLKPP